MADLRPILLVEDNLKDVELTLAALAKCQLANDIVVAVDFNRFFEAIQDLGMFWGVLNETPPRNWTGRSSK